jgi:uncharacterized protein
VTIAARSRILSGAARTRWLRLKASYGEIVATGESYETKAGARKGVEAVQRAAAGANVVDKTDD